MKKIVLLSCTKKKKDYSCTAREMYSASEIFTTAYKYAKLISNDIYILSSKYGLLSCDDIVEPYDECINDITLEERKEWARGIIDSLTQFSNLQEDYFEIITGKAYYEDLIDSLTHYSIPLKGKGISQWIPSLNILIQNLNNSTSVREANVLSKTIHEMCWTLPKYHYLMIDEIPFANGVYIMFDKTELLYGGHRIVRIGTHTSNDRLKKRLKQHFFTEDKNRSIFRKHIGRCILNENGDAYLNLWENDTRIPEVYEKCKGEIDINKERLIESQVSSYLRRNIFFCCIEINNSEDRLRIEEGLISSLNKDDTYYASAKWLGNYSSIATIRSSGMWNIQGLNGIPLTQNEYAKYFESLDVAFKMNTSRNCTSANPKINNIIKYIQGKMDHAHNNGFSYIEIVSGEIHKELSLSSAMPSVCCAMYKLKTEKDHILSTTPSGKSSTIKIRYNLK